MVNVFEFHLDQNGYSTADVETKLERTDRRIKEEKYLIQILKRQKRQETFSLFESLLKSDKIQYLLDNLESYLKDMKLDPNFKIETIQRTEELRVQFRIQYDTVYKFITINLWSDKQINLNQFNDILIFEVPKIKILYKEAISHLDKELQNRFKQYLIRRIHAQKSSCIEKISNQLKNEAKNIIQSESFLKAKELILESYMRKEIECLEDYVDLIPLEMMMRLIKELYVKQVMES